MGRGVGELVVVGLGHNVGLKGKSEGEGMFMEEEGGVQEGRKGKKPKEDGKGKGDGKKLGKG